MKTLIIRSHDKSVSMTIKADIFASNAELQTPGFETRFTNMTVEEYSDADKVLIDLRPIENSWQGIIAAVKAKQGLGLFLYDSSEIDNSTDQQEDLITITGTSGTATVMINGNDFLVTFNTDLETTGDDFVTDIAADVLSDVNAVVTSPAAGKLLFVGEVGRAYEVLISNTTGTLDGTVENTVLAKTGTSEITIVAPHHEVV